MSTILKALRKVEREQERRDPQDPPPHPEPPSAPEPPGARRRRRSWHGVAAGLIVGSIAYAFMPLLLSDAPSPSATEPIDHPASSVEDGARVKPPPPRLDRAKKARTPRTAMAAASSPPARRTPPSRDRAVAPVPSRRLPEGAAPIGRRAPAPVTPELTKTKNARPEVAQATPAPLPERSAPARKPAPAEKKTPPPPTVERAPAPPAPPVAETPPEPAPAPRVEREDPREEAPPPAPRVTTPEPPPREPAPKISDAPPLEPSLLVLAPVEFPEVAVTRVRWHPDPGRRTATVELENAGPLDVSEGDIVAGVMIGEIMPASIELRVGDRSRVVTIQP